VGNRRGEPSEIGRHRRRKKNKIVGLWGEKTGSAERGGGVGKKEKGKKTLTTQRTSMDKREGREETHKGYLAAGGKTI